MAATMLAESPTTDEARPMDLTVRRAQQGETAAFEQLYHAHVGRVYALCLRLCSDSTRAEELTQDVFVRAWEKLGSFQGKSAFSTWLHRLAVNVVLGDRRSEGVRVHRVFGTDEPEKYETPSLRGSDPGIAMDLERAIAQLPPGARSVFVLHDVEGYKHHEIATLLEISAGTSKAQLHRARMMLRKHLGPRNTRPGAR
jgi:RNA polymerase sigma-70 factor (ECF subfamily)